MSHYCVGGWVLGDYGTVHELIPDVLPAAPALVGLGSTINFAEGDNARMLDFSGNNTSDRVNLGTVPSGHPLQGSAPFAVLFRCFPNTGAGNSSFWRIVDKSNGGDIANGWGVWLNQSSARWEFGINSPGSGYADSANASVTKGSWTTTLFAYDGSNYYYYINGTQTKSSTYSESFVNVATAMALGNWNHSVDREWYGLIDYVLVSLVYPSTEEARILTTPGNEYLLFRKSPDLPFAAFLTPPAPGGNDYTGMFLSA